MIMNKEMINEYFSNNDFAYASDFVRLCLASCQKTLLLQVPEGGVEV